LLLELSWLNEYLILRFFLLVAKPSPFFVYCHGNRKKLIKIKNNNKNKTSVNLGLKLLFQDGQGIKNIDS